MYDNHGNVLPSTMIRERRRLSTEPTFTAEDALTTTCALRDALGLPAEPVPAAAFVERVGDEIEPLRAAPPTSIRSKTMASCMVRDSTDPDGHAVGALWMDIAAMPA